MQNENRLTSGEMLRRAMRHWVTGVAVATSRLGDITHGMTVNSFISISIEPPLVTVAMNNDTRTLRLVEQSGIFAVTMLSLAQQPLAELFAGRLPDSGDRMNGLDTFELVTGAPLLHGGVAFVDCQVVGRHPLPLSTLFIGEVLAAQTAGDRMAPGEIAAPDRVEVEPPPLVYYHRRFTRLRD